MKKIIKNNIFGFIIGTLLFGGIGVYAAIKLQASEVSYNGTTVEEALNELRDNSKIDSFKIKYHTYVDDNIENDIFNKYDDLHLKSFTCKSETQVKYDANNKKITFDNINNNDECNLYFDKFSLSDEKINLNLLARKSFSADTYDGSNVPQNAINGSMTNGNGNNWYGGTKLLIEYNNPVYIENIGVYTTNNWGYAFNNAKIYYSADDSLSLNSDLSKYNYVTVSTESDILLNKPLVAKKVLLTKKSTEAVYEFKCLGYTIN